MTTGTATREHYLFTPEHDMLREAVRTWALERVQPHIAEWDEAGEFPRAIFEELGTLGYLGVQYPEEYGGGGMDFAANLVLCEEIARVGADSVSAGIAVHSAMATPPIYKFGTDEQRRRYLPDLLAGRKIAALAISEPDSGSDVASLRTRATKNPDGTWTLTGSKTFITNGGRADVVLVVARTPSLDNGRPGFSLFLVDTKLPGFSRGRLLDKIGRKASDTSELMFDDLQLPADALIGTEGRGFQQIMWELDGERLMAAATSCALGFYALELGISYLKSRKQFGKHLAEFQAIRHELANRTAELTAARELVYTTARRFQAGEERLPEVAMAKLLATRAVNDMADYVLQVHGGYGYMKEYPIGGVWIDARVKRITAGTDEIQRELIARAILGRPES